jgi:uncharacterized membrane protein YqaE (UPF0057 family)
MENGSGMDCGMFIGIAFVIGLVVMVLGFVLRKKIVCTSCLYVGYPMQSGKGNIIIEIILYCCGILPGIVYTLWRISSKQKVCPQCKLPNIIPINSVRGKQLVDQMNQSARPPLV